MMQSANGGKKTPCANEHSFYNKCQGKNNYFILSFEESGATQGMFGTDAHKDRSDGQHYPNVLLGNALFPLRDEGLWMAKQPAEGKSKGGGNVEEEPPKAFSPWGLCQ